MCAFCGNTCDWGGPDVETIPVSFLIDEWRTHAGPALAQWVRPVAHDGKAVFLLQLCPIQASDRAEIETTVLNLFDSPTWREKITRVEWLAFRGVSAHDLRLDLPDPDQLPW
jgi:hypothetical protein